MIYYFEDEYFHYYYFITIRALMYAGCTLEAQIMTGQEVHLSKQN